jgi:hypothetical protein
LQGVADEIFCGTALRNGVPECASARIVPGSQILAVIRCCVEYEHVSMCFFSFKKQRTRGGVFGTRRTAGVRFKYPENHQFWRFVCWRIFSITGRDAVTPQVRDLCVLLEGKKGQCLRDEQGSDIPMQWLLLHGPCSDRSKNARWSVDV